MTKLIYEYKTAIYKLAIEMSQIRKTKGRKVLEDTSGFDLSRINILCGIGDIYNPTIKELLPEHWMELAGESKMDRERYIKVAIQQNLKPSQLRKYIRNDKRKVTSMDKNVKVNSWAKNIVLLENDIKSMSNKEKQRALAHLTNTLMSL